MPWTRKSWYELQAGEMNQRMDDTLMRFINAPDLIVDPAAFLDCAGIEMPEGFKDWPMWTRLEAAIKSGRRNKPAADAKAAETAAEQAKRAEQYAYWRSRMEEAAALAPQAPFLGIPVGDAGWAAPGMVLRPGDSFSIGGPAGSPRMVGANQTGETIQVRVAGRAKKSKKAKPQPLVLDAPRVYFAD